VAESLGERSFSDHARAGGAAFRGSPFGYPEGAGITTATSRDSTISAEYSRAGDEDECERQQRELPKEPAALAMPAPRSSSRPNRRAPVRRTRVESGADSCRCDKDAIARSQASALVELP